MKKRSNPDPARPGVPQSAADRGNARARHLRIGTAVFSIAIPLLVLLPEEWLRGYPALKWTIIGVGLATLGADYYAQYRRLRPRGRWGRAAGSLAALALICLLLSGLAYAGLFEAHRGAGLPFLGMAVVLLIAAGGSCYCWRRMCAEAELRLWNLRNLRRKRLRYVV